MAASSLAGVVVVGRYGQAQEERLQVKRVLVLEVVGASRPDASQDVPKDSTRPLRQAKQGQLPPVPMIALFGLVHTVRDAYLCP